MRRVVAAAVAAASAGIAVADSEDRNFPTHLTLGGPYRRRAAVDPDCPVAAVEVDVGAAQSAAATAWHFDRHQNHRFVRPSYLATAAAAAVAAAVVPSSSGR